MCCAVLTLEWCPQKNSECNFTSRKSQQSLCAVRSHTRRVCARRDVEYERRISGSGTSKLSPPSRPESISMTPTGSMATRGVNARCPSPWKRKSQKNEKVFEGPEPTSKAYTIESLSHDVGDAPDVAKWLAENNFLAHLEGSSQSRLLEPCRRWKTIPT